MVRNSAAVFTTACRKKGEAAGRGLVRTVVCLCLLLLVSGCTPKLYNIDMRYQPTKTITPALNDGRKYSLMVASFIDRRKMEDTLLIGRVITRGGSTIPPRSASPSAP